VGMDEELRIEDSHQQRGAGKTSNARGRERSQASRERVGELSGAPGT